MPTPEHMAIALDPSRRRQYFEYPDTNLPYKASYAAHHIVNYPHGHGPGWAADAISELANAGQTPQLPFESFPQSPNVEDRRRPEAVARDDVYLRHLTSPNYRVAHAFNQVPAQQGTSDLFMPNPQANAMVDYVRALRGR